MSEMIERVSRVLCECAGFDPDEPVVMLSKPGGKGARWEFHEPAARAAIKAMREPTEEMWKAEHPIWSLGRPMWEWWRQMIDEALK